MTAAAGELFHYALAQEWDAALTAGEYDRSTRGRSLADEGFIHLAHADQLAGVWSRFWADETAPVVLLTVDADALTDDLVAENTSGGTELFPHLYGPLPVGAVTAAHPVGADGRPR